MARIVYEMGKDEKKLYNELIKEVKTANTRIRRLQKLGIKEPFAVKELTDLLKSKQLNAITKSGYISLKKSYNLQQLLGLKRAIENFKSGASTIKEINKVTKEYSEKLGKPLTYRQANTLYRLYTDYDWIYDYIPKSEFWDNYAPLALTMEVTDWVEQLKYRAEGLNDKNLARKLEALYLYCNGGDR